MSTHNIPFSNMKKKFILNYPKSAAMGFVKGPKNKFETAVVNEPLVFEPLKFYCIPKISEVSASDQNIPIQKITVHVLNLLLFDFMSYKICLNKRLFRNKG